MKKIKIALDAGHGGTDPGAVNRTTGLQEKTVALNVVNQLGKILSNHNIEIIYTRPTDSTTTIDNRWRAANSANADYFISIHTNAGGGTGVETLIPTASPQNLSRDLALTRKFAEHMSANLTVPLGLPIRRERGVMLESQTGHKVIGVLRNTKMPAILIELGFIDSPATAKDLDILTNQQGKIAQILADALLNFLNIARLPDGQAPKPNTITVEIFGKQHEVLGEIKDGTTWIGFRNFAELLGFTVDFNTAKNMPIVNKP